MRLAKGVSAILVAGVASCSAANTHAASDGRPGRTCDPAGRTASPLSRQDLADFIYHDGAFYYVVATGSPPPQVLIQLGRVSCTLAGSATPMESQRPREGLAGFVPEGTEYFSIRACSNHDAIAVKREGRLRVFLRQRPTNEAAAVRDALERRCAHAISE